MQRCLEFFFYIPNDIFNRQVVYDSTFTNMETLFNLTLYDVKIQKYMSNSLKKKEEEKTPTIYMLTYIYQSKHPIISTQKCLDFYPTLFLIT